MTISYDRDLPVLIFKCGKYPLHAGSLAVVRSFGRVGIPVYGTYEDRFVPAAVSKYLKGKFLWRARPDDTAAVLSELCEIGNSIGTRALLVPTDDLASILIAENTETLRPYFRFPTPPPGLPRALANKRRLFHMCAERDVPTAKTILVKSAEEFEALVRDAAFPLVMKIAEPWRWSAGAAVPSTSLAADPATARQLFEAVTLKGCSDLVFQEYIPSDCAADWFFHGYSDSSGRCLAAFTGLKLRSCPPWVGRTAYCRAEANPDLCRQVEALISAISFNGIVDLDFRFDARDGKYKLLDFNPRIGAQFSVFRDENDVDVVRALHLDISGREVPRSQMRSRSLMIEDLDLRVAFRYRKISAAALSAWISEFRNATEHGWYSRDDFWPVVWMAARNVAHFCRKLFGRFSRRWHRFQARSVSLPAP